MKPVRIVSIFHGDKHGDLWSRCLVKSLCWPQNKHAIQSRPGSKFVIYTEESRFPEATATAKDLGIDIELHAIDPYLEKLNTKYLGDNGIMMLQMFLVEIKKCIELGSVMLLAPPDTIFGGDSIANMLQASEQPGVVVFVIHIRVHPSLIDALERQVNRFGPATSISNAKLVSLATEGDHAHRSFTEAVVGSDRINSFVGGIVWRRRPNGVIALSHFLPTPYIINWTKDDLDFFSRKNPPGEWPQVFGQIDHEWPSACVYPQERARVLGSSCDAFIVEITEPNNNVPPLQPYDKGEPDKFWRRAFHNRVNRQFVVTLKPEDS